MFDLTGLSQINVELTSRCNKKCWMCGRREREKLYGDQDYGDMDISLVKLIADEIPENVIVALHNNGEPLVYPWLGDALDLFKNHKTYFVTNGKLLFERADDIIGKVDIISVSVIEGDHEYEKTEQKEIIKAFIEKKGNKKPNVILRFVGCVDEKYYDDVKTMRAYRTLHMPKGSVGYRRPPTVPEHGVCLDLLTRLAIDRHGFVSLCVRFDPDGELRLGNIIENSLVDMWNSPKRLLIVEQHIKGLRKQVPFCGNKCEFYGVPTSDV